MADFSKKIGAKRAEKKTHPVEIYDTLDRTSETGPLRPIQKSILENWHRDFKNKQDVILKLHTGQGKTLIGLLILKSHLNSENGPALYLCPNRHLAIQTAEQAKKFGIPFDILDEDIPVDFTAGKRILIGHVQKLFNGWTKFGLQRRSINVGAIVLDDSHACIDAIKGSFTLNIPSSEECYSQLVELFDEDLKLQGLSSYQEMRQGDYEALLPIAYWAWIDKIEVVTEILTAHREKDFIKFQWPILKEVIIDCQVLVSGTKIEISPYLNPIEQFGTFSNASQRILMSATTLDDSFFIKGLGLSKDAVKNPLRQVNEKWSGEKMILIPSLIDDNLDRIKIINDLVKPNPRRKFGLVVLVPSFKRTEIYKMQDCSIATKDNILSEVQRLKDGDYAVPLIIVNRYDGIDLPDDSCRVLVLDSKPMGESLLDRFEESCRPHSDLINIRIAQKIEQGLGRSVRGEKDYGVIILLGDELVSFAYNQVSQKYFSGQTRKQISIGLEIAELAKDDINQGVEPLKAFYDLIGQCIRTRDENWKSFYETSMEDIGSQNEERNEIISIIEAEFEAERANQGGDYQKATSIIQDIVNRHIKDDSEKGWYLQAMARFQFKISKINSNKYQVAAFKKNKYLLKPTTGIDYEKLAQITGDRVTNIQKWLSRFSDFTEVHLSVENILSNLTFGTDYEKFENALYELGLLLGFSSQRPDREIKQGPDNIWCIGKNDFLLFECKNEVKETRTEISRLETGQMNNACGWFDLHYPGVEVSPIMIIPVKNVTAGGSFNHHVKIMRKGKLKLLKENVRSLFKEFKKFKLDSITIEQIQEAVDTHKLDVRSLKSEYSEDPRQMQ